MLVGLSAVLSQQFTPLVKLVEGLPYLFLLLSCCRRSCCSLASGGSSGTVTEVAIRRDYLNARRISQASMTSHRMIYILEYSGQYTGITRTYWEGGERTQYYGSLSVAAIEMIWGV